MTTETTTPAQTPTIHDAIDALFAEKAAAAPAPVSAPAAEEPKPIEAAAPEQTEAAAEGEPTTEEAPEQPKPEPTKVSASDYAVQLARAKKKLAQAKPAAPVAQPSAEAIKRAAAIEAAGGDPLKAFEAAGLDLQAVVKAYEKRVIEEPDYPDPLAKELKTLSDRLAQYEEREKAAEEARSVSQFFDHAKQMIAAKETDFAYVQAYGDDGLALVKTLVLSAAEGDEENGIPPQTLPLREALKMAEAHYRANDEKAAKAREALKPKQPSQTKKPGLPQGAPAAGVAPAQTTAPRSVQDVINQSIDALLG
jgi:hypothetical protein